MGSFDSTCAITRTAIHHYDEAYLIHWQGHLGVMDKQIHHPRRTTYDLIGTLHKEASLHSTYTGLPYDERPKVWSIFAKDIKLYRGTYDDYGWLEEHRDLVRDDRPDHSEYFFVHAFVVDAIREWANVDSDDPLDTVKAIAEYAYMTRTPLFAENWLLGEQYAHTDELKAQRHLLLLMEKGVEKIEDRWEIPHQHATINWIPIKEMLPEENETVLFCLVENDKGSVIRMSTTGAMTNGIIYCDIFPEDDGMGFKAPDFVHEFFTEYSLTHWARVNCPD